MCIPMTCCEFLCLPVARVRRLSCRKGQCLEAGANGHVQVLCR
jgi:hypothetical protein